MKQGLMGIAVGVALGCVSGIALGGAFGVATQSGSGTGNAYSGGAAAAEDAGALWYNPALMSALPPGKHLALSGHALRPSFTFRDQASTIPPALGSGDGGDGGGWAFIPNAAFAMSLGSEFSFGISLNAPYGLKTDYDDGWIGRRIGIMSEIRSVNLNPAIAYRLNPTVVVGAGVSVQYLEADLDNASALGTAHLSANDVGYGFNLGVAIQASPSTRVGLAYRSSIDFTLDGRAEFKGLPAANVDAKADLRTPESVSLSVFTVVNPKWEVMADLTWTRWSRIKAIVPTCQSASAIVCSGPGAPILGSTLPTNWKDTWRLGVGANYKYSADWKFRFGLAFDPTPTNDNDRTARLPDEDRLWVAAGAQYALSKNGRIEIGYAHEFIQDARVNTQVFGTSFRQVGHFENRADILTFSYSHAF